MLAAAVVGLKQTGKGAYGQPDFSEQLYLLCHPAVAGKNLFSWGNRPVKKAALTRRRRPLRRLERPRPVGNGEGPAGRAAVALPASLQLLLQVSQGCVVWGNHSKGLSDTRQERHQIWEAPLVLFCSPECLSPQEPSTRLSNVYFSFSFSNVYQHCH